MKYDDRILEYIKKCQTSPRDSNARTVLDSRITPTRRESTRRRQDAVEAALQRYLK